MGVLERFFGQLSGTVPTADFVVVDVETANHYRHSICQIGIARFSNGQIVDTWGSIIDPEMQFDDINIKIHGITPAMVKNKPTWPQVAKTVRAKMSGATPASYSRFDMDALRKSYQRYNLTSDASWFRALCGDWCDILPIAQHVWPHSVVKNHKLKTIAKHLGITYRQHDALEDSITAGKVLYAAHELTGSRTISGIYRWSPRLVQRTAPVIRKPKRDYVGYQPQPDPPNSSGYLLGNIVVFAGNFSVTRDKLKKMATDIGCVVDEHVTEETTIVVARKNSKAKEYASAMKVNRVGGDIRIIDMEEFVSLANAQYSPGQSIQNRGRFAYLTTLPLE